MKLFKKILYGIRIVSNILFLILLILMLPYIYQSSWQGVLFFSVVLIYIGILLWTLLTKKKIYQETMSYNLIMICIFFYFALVTFRILCDVRIQSDLYMINIDYCKNNFFLMSLIIIGMILNTILLSIAEEEPKEDKKKITLN